MSEDNRHTFRVRVYRQLNPAAWPHKGVSPSNRVVCMLILAASAVAVIETEPAIQTRAPTLLLTAEAVFAGVFLLEYLARVYAAGEDPRYRGLAGRFRYMTTWWAIVDLLAIVPFFLTFGSYNTVLIRLIRFVRILRLARLGPLSNAWDALTNAVMSRRCELAITTGVAGVLMVFSSALLYLAEASAQPEVFGSIPRAFWWSVATLTTVGYGDVTPVTPLGQVFAGITALAGIGLVAMPAGILAATVSEAFQQQRGNE